MFSPSAVFVFPISSSYIFVLFLLPKPFTGFPTGIKAHYNQDEYKDSSADP
jgi:hypothetical protein